MNFEEHEKRRLRPSPAPAEETDAVPPGSAFVAETISLAWVGLSHRLSGWFSIRLLGQLAANLVLVAAVVGIVTLSARMPGSKNSAHEPKDFSEIRPASFTAEEIFLPRSLLARARDADLGDILRMRDVERLDAFLEANELRDAWFLVRYRGIKADGSTWRNMNTNFECKRYHAHSSGMKELDNRLGNLGVLARVLARSAGSEPDAIVADEQGWDPSLTIIHFDKARVIPIPDDATGREQILKNHLDDWRSKAAMGGR